jgi:hypothetical protein
MSEDKILPEKESSHDIPTSAGENQPVQPDVKESKQESVKSISESQPLPNESFEPIPLQKLETEKMEIHHHGHVHEKKKWKEYLFQFLMLFLAVFCGFLAEYQLEHIIENSREKQFMQSMVEDLHKDIVTLERHFKFAKRQQAGLDSLNNMLNEGRLEKVDVREMYILQKKHIRFAVMRLVNRTELQLKNSGGMRLIRNKTVADAIIKYWGEGEKTYTTIKNLENNRDKAWDMSHLLFHNKYYKNTESLENVELIGDPELISKDPVLLSTFSNRVDLMMDMIRMWYKHQLVELEEDAKNLIQLIIKEYDLERG